MDWDEAKHPRLPGGPGGGEFTHPGGWLSKLGDAITGRAPQRDLSRDNDTLDYAAANEWVSKSNGMGFPPTPDDGDRALGRIYERQGFHAKPEVVSARELDQRVASGWVEMRRGFGGDPAHLEAFRSGDWHYPGLGQHANGSYASRDISFADYAMPQDGVPAEQWPTVLRMALRPDARVVTLYGPEWKLWNDEVRHYRDNNTQASLARLAVLSEFGRWVALRGYDAIRIPGGYQADRGYDTAADIARLTPEDHYAILNRGAVAVEAAR